MDDQERRTAGADDLRERLDAIERMLTALLARERPRRRANPDALLVTKAEAARRLGIDRKTTLNRLIREKHLHVVPHGNRERIPSEDIERLAREGIPPPTSSRLRAAPTSSRLRAAPANGKKPGLTADETYDAVRRIRVPSRDIT